MKMKKHVLQVKINSYSKTIIFPFKLLAKRPAKENIEKFLHAEYTLHGTKLFVFLFGEKIAQGIDENSTFWFDALASAFSGKIFFSN